MRSKFWNRRWRLNNFYKIIDKNGKSIIFKLNKAQETIYDLEKDYKWFIILKARQLGMSTYKLISGLDKTLFYPNQTVVITAHKQDKQKELFQIVKYAFSQLPEQVVLENGQIREKPKPQYDSVNELSFKENNSRIRVSLDSRSGTPTDSHITELAFRKDAEEMMTGTLPSIPKNASVTIETTANGIGNYFHSIRHKNYKKKDGEFYCVFIPRYTDENYRSHCPDGFRLPDELSHLYKLPLDKEQHYWYYKQWKLLGKYVFQEMPSTPEEAFLTTGNPVFSQQAVKSMQELGYDEDVIYKDLWIYRDAVEGEIYNIGVDTAEGGAEGDYSAVSVRDKDLNLMAFYYGHIPADELTKIVDRIYTLGYIAPGKIGIERNNTGIATLSKAKDFYRYQDLYAEKTVDKITNKKTKKYGRHTNIKTRPLMISEYEEVIRTGLLTEVDERLRRELYTFVYNEKNKPEALQGCHDDGIMCDAICVQMLKEIPLIEFG